MLKDFGLRHYFREIVESAVVGVRKPDPRIFELGCEALGLPPAEVLVVGDSLKKTYFRPRAWGAGWPG